MLLFSFVPSFMFIPVELLSPGNWTASAPWGRASFPQVERGQALPASSSSLPVCLVLTPISPALDLMLLLCLLAFFCSHFPLVWFHLACYKLPSETYPKLSVHASMAGYFLSQLAQRGTVWTISYPWWESLRACVCLCAHSRDRLGMEGVREKSQKREHKMSLLKSISARSTFCFPC